MRSPLTPTTRSHPRGPQQATEAPKRVYIFARKALARNTRIFKQAKSLADAGYEVLVIGIKSRDAADSEERDGYTIRRLTMRSLHGRLPRIVDRVFLALERGLDGRFPAGARVVRAVRVPLTARLRRDLGRVAWPLRSLEYYKESYKLMRSGLPVPDVFHANDLDTLLIAAFLARRHRRPLIYDAQELYTEMHTLPRWYARLLRRQERLLIGVPDRVTVVNDAIADVMQRRYGRRVDAVILNCPPLVSALDHAPAATVRERCAVPGGARVLLYSGALTPRRGIENTLLALEHLPEWHLAIVGDGPLKQRLIELADGAGLVERLRFTDFVAHDEVPGFISSADVGVIPYEDTGANHYLCSPSKLFHYLMAELPIACSDFPFLRQVVAGNRVGATFDPADPASIARAVRQIADDPVIYEQMKARTRLLKRRYSWEEEEKRFMTIYESLPGPPRP